MTLWQSFLARFRREPPAPEPRRARTKPHLIEAAIRHEIMASGAVTVEIVCDRHPDFLPSSVGAAFRRLVKSGGLVKVVDGSYRVPEGGIEGRRMSLVSRKKPPRLRLIDDTEMAISRSRSRSADRKEDGWFRSPDHLAWVRTQNCCFALIDHGQCGGEVEAAHVRIGTDGGTGVKPSDFFVTPQCQKHHKLSHMIGERSFWGPDVDAAGHALKIAMLSPDPKTRAAAAAEIQRRSV